MLRRALREAEARSVIRLQSHATSTQARIKNARLLVTDEIDPEGVDLLRSEPAFVVDEIPTPKPAELRREDRRVRCVRRTERDEAAG